MLTSHTTTVDAPLHRALTQHSQHHVRQIAVQVKECDESHGRMSASVIVLHAHVYMELLM